MAKTISFINVAKNKRVATIGVHHYSIGGDYYHGFDVFYASGENPPPKGLAWVEIGNANSLGKGEAVARAHYRKIREAA